MRYVILRDDDTNALTPIECLEQLYRPFLERGLPVNLAVIPKVLTNVRQADGRPEGYLLDHKSTAAKSLPIGSNERLVRYLLENPGYHIAQHGYHHSLNEFESSDSQDISHRLAHGTELLIEAGLPAPKTFVAPYDKFSEISLELAARRFRVISTGWFERRRLPVRWWAAYLVKKLRRRPHWRVGSTWLLSHPGCLLSFHHPYDVMLQKVQSAVQRQPLTVLVTHWWEYFRDHRPDLPFIAVLDNVAEYLASSPDIRVISFDDVPVRMGLS